MNASMRIIVCLVPAIILANTSGTSAAVPQEVGDLLKAIAAEESKLNSLRTVQTEHLTHGGDSLANVTKRYEYEEQAGSYRLSIEYPGLSSVPKAVGKGANATYAYVPCQTAFDGRIMTHHVPYARSGFVSNRRTRGQIDSYPVSNHHPYWPYNMSTLHEFLSTLVNKPEASVSVKSASGDMIELRVDSGAIGVVFTLDPSKGYNPVQLDSYYEGRLTDHRVFSKYVERDGVWLAQKTRVEMYGNRPGVPGRTILYTVEDGWTVNTPISPQRFRLVFPVGTFVRDFCEGTSYLIEDTTGILESQLSETLGKSLDSPPGQMASHGVLHRTVAEARQIASQAREARRAEAAAAAAAAKHTIGVGDWFLLAWRPGVAILGIAFLGVVVVAVLRKNRRLEAAPRRRLGNYGLIVVGLVGMASCAAFAWIYLGDHQLGPALALESHVVDVGTIPAERVHAVRIPVYNPGTATVRITDIKKSCSCSSAKMTHRKIEPGGKAMLEVHYTPTPNTTRDFRTAIVLVSNASAETTNIILQGKSVPTVEVAPPSAYLGKIRKGSTRSVSFKFFDPDGFTLSTTTSPGLAETAEAKIASTERFEEDGRTGLKLTLLASPTKVGEWKQSVKVGINHPDLPQVELTVGAMVNDEVNPWPAAVEFARSDTAAVQTARVELNGLPWDASALRAVCKPDLLTLSMAPMPIDPQSTVLTAQLRFDRPAADLQGGYIELLCRDGDASSHRVCAIPFVVRGAPPSLSKADAPGAGG